MGLAMSPLLELDGALVRAVTGVEDPALTTLFALLSAWWVKGPLLVALGLGADLWSRRPPLACAAAAVATAGASLAVTPLKDLFERARPPLAEPGLRALVAIPENASFPSGHSATAFAAATAVAVLCPRLRPVVLVLAAGVAVSRVYLRVHFPLDVLAGGLLGAAMGVLAALAARQLAAEVHARSA
jgi:membrane-associated phospholipid phosphatase